MQTHNQMQYRTANPLTGLPTSFGNALVPLAFWQARTRIKITAASGVVMALLSAWPQ